MTNIQVAAWALVLATGGGQADSQQAEATKLRRDGKPNVVLIVADDLGYGELGCYGGKEIPTPHIDALAKEGVRLTDGYVSCPVCAPTRAGVLTGRYGPRFGFEFNPGPQQTAADTFGLPKGERTLAERLAAEGYVTGMVGKWHLGYADGLTPPDRGFASFFGFLGGAHSYRLAGRAESLIRGKERVNEPTYLTYAFGREAVGFIEANKSKPFLLYLPFNAVHAPLQAPQNLAGRMKQFPEGKRRTFAGMLMAMDDSIGRVMTTLRANGLDRNTLVVFISDNGGPTAQTTSSNGPLRGFKGQTWEGGIRVPFMLRWVGNIPAGQTFEKPAISLDIVPTVLAAAGRPIPPKDKLDGVDLLPYLRGQQRGAPHSTLYWRFGQQHAIREGNWKLVTTQGATDALFDLSKDLGERQNLAEREPSRVRALKAKWEAWSKELMNPAWGRAGNQED